MKFRWGTLFKCWIVLFIAFIIVYFICVSIVLTIWNAILGPERGIIGASLTLVALWPALAFTVLYRQKLRDATARREYLKSMEGMGFDRRFESGKIWRDPVFRGELLAMSIAIALFAIDMSFFVVIDILAFILFNWWAWLRIRKSWIAERLRY